jgi:hypothetical protein
MVPRRLGWKGPHVPLGKFWPHRKFWIALGAVGLLAGAAAVAVSLKPVRTLVEDAVHGDRLREQRQLIADPLTTDHWRKADRTDKGVTIWNPIAAQRGFTLYTSGEGPVARLVTMNGTIAHEWAIPYSRIWTKEAAAVQEPQPDNLIFLRQARVLPNGDLIAVFEAAGHVPAGYGLVRVDKESKPVWSYLQRAHGGFDMAPDGRVFALVQAIREDDTPTTMLKTPFLEEFVAVLSPEGRETARISVVEALERSRYASLLAKVSPGQADPLGVTSIQFMGDNAVKGVPGGHGERVLLSLSGVGAVAILDVASRQIVWAMRGEWNGPREVRVLPGGDLLMVDTADGKTARTRQFDPSTSTVTWSYGGDEGHPLAADARLSAQRLANGNTLLTDSGNGTLFEVDKDGTVVWEFTNPTRAGQNGGYMPVITSGQRIAARDLHDGFRGFTRP